jgi:hypothetical protein
VAIRLRAADVQECCIALKQRDNAALSVFESNFSAEKGAGRRRSRAGVR